MLPFFGQMLCLFFDISVALYIFPVNFQRGCVLIIKFKIPIIHAFVQSIMAILTFLSLNQSRIYLEVMLWILQILLLIKQAKCHWKK